MEKEPRKKTLKCDLFSWVVIIMHVPRFDLVNSILSHGVYFRMSPIMPYSKGSPTGRTGPGLRKFEGPRPSPRAQAHLSPISLLPSRFAPEAIEAVVCLKD